MVVGFLFLVCVGAALAEPVEDEETASVSTEPTTQIVSESDNANPEQVDEDSAGESVAESSEQSPGVSFNDIRIELVGTWNFSFNRMISVHDETAVITGTIGDNRFPATLRIEESKGEIEKFEARIDTIEGGKILGAEDTIVLSVGMLSAFMELVLPEWGEEGAEWLVRSGEDLANGNSPVKATYKNAEIAYELESGVLILTIQLNGDGDTETAKAQSPESASTQRPSVTLEPTATPKPEVSASSISLVPTFIPKPTISLKGVSEEDRIAGKHCMSELKKLSKADLQFGMQQPISDRWFGYDPASLKMVEFEIYPLGSEYHSVFVERGRYGDPWSDHEEHVARVEFTVKTDEGLRVKRTAAYWVRNDNCEIALIDFD